MSDELLFPQSNFQNNDLEADSLSDAELEDEFEEITSDEVDRVVSAIEELCETVESLNIRAYLEEAAANIHYLVYEEEDLEDAA